MVIPALRRLSQENLELKASLGYVARPCLKQPKQKTKKKEKEKERKKGGKKGDFVPPCTVSGFACERLSVVPGALEGAPALS